MSFHIIMFILFVEAGLTPIEDARTQFRLCLSIFPMPVVAVVASSFCVSTTFNIMPKYHTHCVCVCVQKECVVCCYTVDCSDSVLIVFFYYRVCAYQFIGS